MSELHNHSIDALLPAEMAEKAEYIGVEKTRLEVTRLLALVPPIAAFVAAGFEHSVANMYLLPFALLTKIAAPVTFWEAISQTPSAFPHLNVSGALTNLLWVTLGNMAGGMMGGIVY